jgi:hypothetical protein
MTPYPTTLEEMLARCSSQTRRVLQTAREGVLTAVPDATERFRSGWGLIGYNAPTYFAFLVADERAVRLGFEWGVALTDPLGLLKGDGRQVRYVTIHAERDIQRTAVVELLREAAAFAPSRARVKKR